MFFGLIAATNCFNVSVSVSVSVLVFKHNFNQKSSVKKEKDLNNDLKRSQSLKG